MTERPNFEDRLRHAFAAEEEALRGRASEAAPAVDVAPMPTGRGSNAAPWIAAAVVLVLGVGLGLVLRAASPAPVVPVAATTPAPLVTATPTPEQMIFVDGEPFFHVVEEGDLLSAIAVRYNVSLDAIRQANPDLDLNVLSLGDRIRIPGASTIGDPPPTPDVEEAPTPTPEPAVPASPLPSSPVGLPGAPAYCTVRSDNGVEVDTCGLVAIQPPSGGQVAVQITDGVGRVEVAFVAVDALAPGPRFDAPIYQPGLLEDTWCVADIFAPDTLNVRQGPSTDREILGELAEGQCGIHVTQGGFNPFTGWVPISVDQPGTAPRTGWVAAAYLRRDVEFVRSGIPTRQLAIRVEGLGGDGDVPPVDAFVFVDGTTRLGSTNTDGLIDVPEAIEPIGLVAQAPVEGDRFCAWTGSLEPPGGDGRYVLRVAMLCA